MWITTTSLKPVSADRYTVGRLSRLNEIIFSFVNGIGAGKTKLTLSIVSNED